MHARSKGIRIKARLNAGIVSAQRSSHSFAEELAFFQNFTYGFIEGTSSIATNEVCKNSLIAFIDAIPDIIDNRFVWIPQYSVKFVEAYERMDSFINSAYVYCNFYEWKRSFLGFFDTNIQSEPGRMLVRILTSLTDSWWFNTNCIVDGMLGLNFYDIGLCSGKMIVIIMDVTLA